MNMSPGITAADGVYAVDDVRAIDSATIAGGVAGYDLMCRAATFACNTARALYPEYRHWRVLCGSGNNAGDGSVVARLAAAAGLQVEVQYVSPPECLQGDAATAWRDAVAAGVEVTAFSGGIDADVELCIDALLGSGLSRPVEGAYREAVDALNAQPAPCVALDVPSGIHGDTGERLGAAVQAEATTTFVAYKPGLFLRDGPDHCGRLFFDSLAAPAAAYRDRAARFQLLGQHIVEACLLPRRRQAHKGDFGHVLVIGGGPGMPGAPRLAGEAALRAGAGKVSVLAHADNVAAISGARPELMCHAAGDTLPAALLAAADVVAIGPGLGTEAWGETLWRQVLDSNTPLVVDADALNLLAAEPRQRNDWILTPHPGEAGRLLGQPTAAIQHDRGAALAALQDKYGGCIVLKGCGTLVSRDGGVPFLCAAGNPGMASGGMGDILTGLIAGLLAQGLPAADAAAIGVFAHASAADAAATFGERGLLASDVLDEVRPWLNP